MQALSISSLPFRGSFKAEITGTLNCPPTCPPTIVTVTATLAGTATHLGQFTATRVDVADLGGTDGHGHLQLDCCQWRSAVQHHQRWTRGTTTSDRADRDHRRRHWPIRPC